MYSYTAYTQSGYPLPEGTIQFQEMPILNEIPFCSLAELTRPPEADKIRKRSRETGAPFENIVENHLNIALFKYLNGRYRHIFIT